MSTASQRITLVAGGTGGHVFPALAIAAELRARQFEVQWIGSEQGMEARLVPQHQIPIDYIKISGLRGKGFRKLLTAPFDILRAIYQAVQILRKQRPQVVVGMGGFVTGPTGIAARLLGIPLVIHEQNAIAGLTNRWLAKIATTVLESFPNTFAESYRPIHTGNPIRAAIQHLAQHNREFPAFTAQRPFHLFVLGGSLGAQALNDIVPQALQKLSQQLGTELHLNVLHQTGEKHSAVMQTRYENQAFSSTVSAFIDDMAAAYQWADLIICRAGASTLAEITQAALPSILVPFPFAVDDHQTANARYLSEQGAAILYPQATLTVDALANQLLQFYQHPETLRTFSDNARRCAKPEALNNAVAAIIALSKS